MGRFMPTHGLRCRIAFVLDKLVIKLGEFK